MKVVYIDDMVYNSYIVCANIIDHLPNDTHGPKIYCDIAQNSSWKISDRVWNIFANMRFVIFK